MYSLSGVRLAHTDLRRHPTYQVSKVLGSRRMRVRRLQAFKRRGEKQRLRWVAPHRRCTLDKAALAGKIFDHVISLVEHENLHTHVRSR